MILINDDQHWWYVNPSFPDSPLSPKFSESSYALQWRGRVGQENLGDFDTLQKQIDDLTNGVRVVVPVSREHAEAMMKIASHYLQSIQ
jgi:hypothetical protein